MFILGRKLDIFNESSGGDRSVRGRSLDINPNEDTFQTEGTVFALELFCVCCACAFSLSFVLLNVLLYYPLHGFL